MNALVIGAMTETLGVPAQSASLLAEIYSRAISESAPVQARYLSNMLGKRAFVERLRDNIYQHGSKFTAPELIQRVTGGPMTSAPYMAYLRGKYGALYDIG